MKGAFTEKCFGESRAHYQSGLTWPSGPHAGPPQGGRAGEDAPHPRGGARAATHFRWISSSSCSLRRSKLTPPKLSPLPSSIAAGQRPPALFPSAQVRAYSLKGHPEAGKTKTLPLAVIMAKCLTVAGSRAALCVTR